MNIKIIQKYENNMLIELKKFLDENKVKYFLDYGTLIGSIRHKGFIPWDDDIDISMTRNEYNRFLNIVKKYDNCMINSHLMITAPELKNTSFCFCKVFDLNYKVKEKDADLAEEYLWIDIFPYDKLCEDKRTNIKNFKKICTIKKIINIKRMKIKELKNNSKSIIKFLLKLPVKIIFKFISINYLTEKVNEIASKYNNNNNNYLQNLVNISELFDGEKESDLNDLIEVEFDGQMYTTLNNYDAHLRKLYGDYMKLPPEEDRESHLTEIWEVNAENDK